jgi:hypothetical protein
MHRIYGRVDTAKNIVRLSYEEFNKYLKEVRFPIADIQKFSKSTQGKTENFNLLAGTNRENATTAIPCYRFNMKTEITPS